MTISKPKALLLAFCALLPLFGYADYAYGTSYCPDPCCPENCDPCPNWCRGFEVGADFLFWNSCINDLDYAIKFDDNPNQSNVTANGCYDYLNHDFEPGFRLRGLKRGIWCGWDVSGSYTWYWAKSSETLTPPAPDGQIFSTIDHADLDLAAGSITRIEASNSLRYQSFDVLFHYEFDCFGPCNLLIPYWGIEGIKIEQETRSFAVGEIAGDPADHRVNWESDVRALGLKLGTVYQYTICGGIKWFTDASFSVVAGNNDTINTQIRMINGSVPTELILTFKDYTDICLPGAHLLAGLSYEKDWCGIFMRARIGYEFLEWWNIPRIRRFFNAGDDIGVSTGSVGSNLALHGLFVGLDVGY